MEIIELLLASGEGCNCFLQLLAVILDISAGTATVSRYRSGKKRKQALARGEPVPPRTPVWPFVLLVVGAIAFTAFVVFTTFR